jgi:hypothetical protein
MPLCLIQVSENFYRPSVARGFFGASTPMIVLCDSEREIQVMREMACEERVARLPTPCRRRKPPQTSREAGWVLEEDHP